MPVLSVEGLRAGVEGRTLFENVSFSVDAGECEAIVGPSGSGKSVLIRALCGLHPSEGVVRVGELSSDKDGWRAVQAKLGVLMSLPGLLDDLTVFDNVAFKLRRDGVANDDVTRRVETVLHEFGLDGSGGKLPVELSGGMRRRAALARALVHNPPCLLLDDPTAGLDPITTTSAIAFILDVAARHGAAVLLTTHDLLNVAARAHTVHLLRSKTLVSLDGGPKEWARELAA